MTRRGVVTASALNVRPIPSTNEPRIGSLARGAPIKIIGEQVDWYQIDLSPAPGWVASRYVVLDPIAPTIQAAQVKLEAFDGPLSDRPKDRKEVFRIFGDPSRDGVYTRDADPTWRAKNIIELHGNEAFLPVLAKSYFPVHHDIEPYAREAFVRADATVPGYVQRAGTWSFNFRHMRHKVTMPLSYHSWGIAIDVNSDDNAAVEFEPGETPAPWSAAWMTRWPRGVPEGVVRAFESCGFAWGGHWKGYCDPMHFEWLGQAAVQV